jgi:hypothetical protein
MPCLTCGVNAAIQDRCNGCLCLEIESLKNLVKQLKEDHEKMDLNKVMMIQAENNKLKKQLQKMKYLNIANDNEMGKENKEWREKLLLKEREFNSMKKENEELKRGVKEDVVLKQMELNVALQKIEDLKEENKKLKNTLDDVLWINKELKEDQKYCLKNHPEEVVGIEV